MATAIWLCCMSVTRPIETAIYFGYFVCVFKKDINFEFRQSTVADESGKPMGK
jgi:hypothetical protein